MCDKAGGKPTPELSSQVRFKPGPEQPDSAIAISYDGSSLYVEGALIMQGVLAR